MPGISAILLLAGGVLRIWAEEPATMLFNLPDGLTRMAIEAVQQIKFVSATKDGKPVSQWLDVEYGFNVY